MDLRKSARWLGLMTVVLLAGCAAPASSPAALRALNVVGAGHVEAAPDLAVITLGVQSRNADLGHAVSDNSGRAGRVEQGITGAGVPAEDVQTIAYTVAQMTLFDELGNPTSDVIYQVDNTLQVKLRDLSKLGSLLQGAVAQGANVIQGVSYSVEDPQPLIDQARRAAMSAAQQQAITLSTSAGVTLGPVMTINEASIAPSPVYYAPSFGKGGGGAGDVPITPGSLAFDVTLYVTYELR